MAPEADHWRPCVQCFLRWQHPFENKKCLLFVDNEGTKFSLRKGLSPNTVVAEAEATMQCPRWLSRVPSHSNFADLPLRGCVEPLAKLGYVDASDLSSKIFTRLLASISKAVGVADVRQA